MYKEAQKRTTYSRKTITPNPSSRLAIIANDLLWEVVGVVCPFMPCICLEIVLVSCHTALLISSVVCGIQVT